MANENIQLNNKCSAIDGGYFIIARKICDSKCYSKGLDYMGLMTELIRRANHKPGHSQGMVVERGQFITSTVKLSAELNISRSKLNRMLKELKSEQFLTAKTDNKRTIITICNYDLYQSFDNYQRTTNDTASGQPADSQRTASDTQTSNKVIKNIYITRYPLISKLLNDEEKELFINWLIVSEKAHGKKQGLSVDEEINRLMKIPEANRTKSLSAALAGAWKNIHEVTPNLKLTGKAQGNEPVKNILEVEEF